MLKEVLKMKSPISLPVDPLFEEFGKEREESKFLQ